jgi:hypothetical protein
MYLTPQQQACFTLWNLSSGCVEPQTPRLPHRSFNQALLWGVALLPGFLAQPWLDDDDEPAINYTGDLKAGLA